MAKFSKLDQAKAKLVIKDPFYATIILETPTIITPDVKTLEVDGENLYVNPTFFESLSLEEAVGVLKHEAMHIALMHPYRGGHRDPEKWNIAADAVINDKLEKEGNALPDGCVRVPNASQWSAEQYYNMLPDMPKQGGGGQGQGNGQGQGQQPPSGGQGQQPQQNGGGQGQQPPDTSNDPLANDVKRAPDQSESAQAKAKAKVARARNVAKARGLMPGDLDELLDEMFNPKVDWKETLRRFLTEVSDDDFSFARPDRRFVAQDVYLPGRFGDESMGEMAVVIDTSGSIGDEEIRTFFGEIKGAIGDVHPEKMVVVYCDSRVNHVDVFDTPHDGEPITPRRIGGGGTDMTEALDYIDEHHPSTKACIVFTDGYTPFGEARAYPTLWGMTTNVEAPWGETVQVEVGGQDE